MRIIDLHQIWCMMRIQNILIKLEDRQKASFTTLLGLFKLNIMFFGMCNSPATFRAFMDNLFEDYITEGWLITYMNNLLIHSSNQETHNECTWKVLQHFQEQKMYLKLEKCMFSAKEVEYLGIIVGKGGVQMDPVRLKAIWEWSPPANIKAIWSFLGFCNFYWKFIPSFSNIACPLLDLTKQPTSWTQRPD